MDWIQIIFIFLGSLLRSQAELATENFVLRQQLAVLGHARSGRGYGTGTGSSGPGSPASGRIGAPSSSSYSPIPFLAGIDKALVVA